MPEVSVSFEFRRGTQEIPGLIDIGINFPEDSDSIDSDELIEQAFAIGKVPEVISILERQLGNTYTNFGKLNKMLNTAVSFSIGIDSPIGLETAEVQYNSTMQIIYGTTSQLQGVIRCVTRINERTEKGGENIEGYGPGTRNSIQNIKEIGTQIATSLKENGESIIRDTQNIEKRLQEAREQFKSE